MSSFRWNRQRDRLTDGQPDMARSILLLIQNIHIYFIRSEMSPRLRCKLLVKINIHSARALIVSIIIIANLIIIILIHINTL